MYTYEGTIAYNEPRTAAVTIDTPKAVSLVEAEDMILEEFENSYPEAIDPELVGEVKDIN